MKKNFKIDCKSKSNSKKKLRKFPNSALDSGLEQKQY